MDIFRPKKRPDEGGIEFFVRSLSLALCDKKFIVERLEENKSRNDRELQDLRNEQARRCNQKKRLKKMGLSH